jgi:signal transduction histidine kinase
MQWERVRRTLIPPEATSNEGFRQELLRESHTGLKAVGLLAVAASLLLMIGWFLFFRDSPSSNLRYLTDLIIIAIGLAAIGVARTSWSYEHARRLAIAAVLLITAVVFAFTLILTSIQPAPEDFLPTQMTLSILALVAAVPLLPWMVILHTLAVGILYFVVVEIGARTFAPGARINPENLLFLAMLGLLATVLSAMLHRQRWRAYSSFHETLKAAADLRRAEARLAISESASSTTRLAAAVSHEINSPIGALSSSVDTLLLLSARQATAPPEQAPRLVKLQSDLRRSIQESLLRLQQTASRLARFTNLDQAERQYTRVNDILTDVAELVRPRLKAGDELILNLQPIPEIPANPQRLSAMLFDLLSNSAAALNGNGRIEVTTRELSSAVQVTITDNGRGIPKARLETIFEPTLQQAAGRVAAGNWSMFNARQIAGESGGTISISSEPGTGTSVTVMLPYGVLT